MILPQSLLKTLLDGSPTVATILHPTPEPLSREKLLLRLYVILPLFYEKFIKPGLISTYYFG